MPSLVDVVICTRNNRDIIGKTLDAVAAQTKCKLECFVVDDRSTDGTVALIQEHAPWVHTIVKKGEPSGPASSRNIGALRGAAPFIVFLDSDAYLSPCWLERQIDFFAQHPDAGIVCGKLVLASRPEILDSAYGSMNRYAVAWNEGAGQPVDCFNDHKRCLFACSAAMMMRRAVWEEIGGFDAAMFAFQEDTDIGWRSNLFGHNVYFNPVAVALHDLHGTMKPKAMGERITYMLWRNRLRSALVNYELGSVARYIGGYLFLAGAHIALYGPRLAKIRALGWNVTHIRDTLRLRARIQSRRRVSDKELWFLFQPGVRGPNRFQG